MVEVEKGSLASRQHFCHSGQTLEPSGELDGDHVTGCSGNGDV
jgi:hypothetical protein